jgi:adenosylhomocysteine nucleosidase
VLPIPSFFCSLDNEANVRILVICPIPLEYTSCRTALSLRDTQSVLGCRAARGAVGNTDIMAVESGPAKARAAAASVAAISGFQPDLVVDAGTCGALDGELIVGAVVLGMSCLEYDISGYGLPQRIIPEMRLPSVFELLPRREGQKLVRALTELGKDRGLHLRSGIQACGEFFIQSGAVRESLRVVSGAVACSWETAGVFVAALRSKVPPISIRVVSDLGDEDAMRDFRRNARRCSQELFRFLRDCLDAGWFIDVYDQWKAMPRTQVDRLPARVLP